MARLGIRLGGFVCRFGRLEGLRSGVGVGLKMGSGGGGGGGW